jgi:hypothetical protein
MNEVQSGWNLWMFRDWSTVVMEHTVSPSLMIKRWLLFCFGAFIPRQ